MPADLLKNEVIIDTCEIVKHDVVLRYIAYQFRIRLQTHFNAIYKDSPRHLKVVTPHE